MNNELEPLKECQFCGSTDPEIRYDLMPNDMWMCKIACWLDAPAVYVECIGVGNTKEEAYEMAASNWNTRHKRTCNMTLYSDGPHYFAWQCSECDGLTMTLAGKPSHCEPCGAEVVDGD